MVYELQETRWLSAARQLHFILSKILDNKETDKRDIVARMTSLREGMYLTYVHIYYVGEEQPSLE